MQTESTRPPLRSPVLADDPPPGDAPERPRRPLPRGWRLRPLAEALLERERLTRTLESLAAADAAGGPDDPERSSRQTIRIVAIGRMEVVEEELGRHSVEPCEARPPNP
jgi:hypothetical protein